MCGNKTVLLQIGKRSQGEECLVELDLRSDTEDCVDELSLSNRIALGYPADLPFADCVHRLSRSMLTPHLRGRL